MALKRRCEDRHEWATISVSVNRNSLTAVALELPRLIAPDIRWVCKAIRGNAAVPAGTKPENQYNRRQTRVIRSID